MIYGFYEFELDSALFELRRSGQRVDVQPKVLSFLLCLVQHRDRVVSKEELRERLWPNQIVGATSLTRAARGARLALSDSGESQRSVRTVRSFGYRFMPTVRELARS